MRNRESEAEELEKLKTKKGKIGTGCEDIREVADKTNWQKRQRQHTATN